MKIRIQCIEKVQFDQIVEISKKDWKEIKKTKDRTMEDGQMSPLPNYLDLKDPMDSQGFDDIELFECDEEGKYKEDGEQWDPWAKADDSNDD